jgi:hypothetical protein
MSKSSVMIKLKINGGRDIELPIEDAKELYSLLHSMFGEIPIVPAPLTQPIWDSPIQPYQPNYPYYRPDITCNTTAQ